MLRENISLSTLVQSLTPEGELFFELILLLWKRNQDHSDIKSSSAKYQVSFPAAQCSDKSNLL